VNTLVSGACGKPDLHHVVKAVKRKTSPLGAEMTPDFVDKARTYVLKFFRETVDAKDRRFSILARAVGYSPQQMQRIHTGEQGARMPMEKFEALAGALGLKMSDVAREIGDERAERLYLIDEGLPEVLDTLYLAIRGGEKSKEAARRAMEMIKMTIPG
jgi:transcriptional regulator with XRE-family HTH domain